jgi:hypothetical protein
VFRRLACRMRFFSDLGAEIADQTFQLENLTALEGEIQARRERLPYKAARVLIDIALD